MPVLHHQWLPQVTEEYEKNWTYRKVRNRNWMRKLVSIMTALRLNKSVSRNMSVGRFLLMGWGWTVMNCNSRLVTCTQHLHYISAAALASVIQGSKYIYEMAWHTRSSLALGWLKTISPLLFWELPYQFVTGPVWVTMHTWLSEFFCNSAASIITDDTRIKFY